MANEIVKVFNTEANAIKNDGTGQINPVAAITDHAGIIANVASEDIPYYIYKKFYYRFEANEPVTEFHIDWDDGEDNSTEKANIEIIKLVSPKHFVITSHIYTEHKHFYPLVRVKSIEGYLSKWYTNDGKKTDGSGSSQNDYSGLETTTLSSGQNEYYTVSLEKTNSDRINSFLPANLPPTGVLKADKKRIYSGIDNDMIRSNFNFPLLYAFSSTSASTKPNIKFTLQDNRGAVREHTLDSSSSSKLVSATGSWDSQGTSGDLATKAVPLGNYTANEIPSVQRITMNPWIAGGTPANWLPWWVAENDAYLDIHYESSSSGDINGNYHCRVFFYSATAGENSEGYPTGATLPSGYTGFKVGAGTSFSIGSEDSVIEALRIALEANNDTAGLKFPFDVSTVNAGPNPYIELTINGAGAVTATSWTSYNTVNDDGNYPSARYPEIVGSVTTAGAGSPTQTTYLRKLLKVELDNATELADSDRVYINVWDAGGSSATPSVLVGSTDPDEALDGTLAVLSNGNPIVEIEDFNTVYLDGTESFTRASNLSISTYKFDDDKLLLKGATQATDGDGASDLLSGTFTSSGIKELSYSFNRIGDSVGSDGRFYSTYRLPRLQVKDSMTDVTAAAALDTLTYSPIEHFNGTTYTAANIEMPSDLESRGLLLYSNKDSEVTATWTDASTNNIDDTIMVFGGTASERPLQDSAAITDHPRNHIFIAKTDKFDRVFFRMDNTNVVGEANWPPTVVITAYYGNGSTWYPLEIIDETQGLQVSGSIKFTMPSDWKKGHYTDIDGGDWKGPVKQTDADNSHGPKELWTTGNIGSAGAYGLLISIGVKGTSNNEHKIVCKNIWPYNNSHSQLIKLEDPHHVSLNSIAIAQSISFGRSSKIISVEDKFGRADIRKIGAAGGSVTFGGIDLGESSDNRKTIVGYQKNATPVFLDIEHKSGEKTRFFGIISQVTEDHPAGMMYPKWAVTMNISHILELSSTGAINSDKISIGGALVDDGKYLL